MSVNLLSTAWASLDSFELRLFLDERIGGPGQSHAGSGDRAAVFLPQAGSACRIRLRFHGSKIVAIEPGPAFDPTEWTLIGEEIDKLNPAVPFKVGRDYSFSSFRVLGWWRGDRSGVQILPPPDHAPRADVELAQHPFILEFPISLSDSWPVTNYRRLREHRRLTLLLNVLLAGRTNFLNQRSDHFWANVPGKDNRHEIKWVQRFFFADLGAVVTDWLSSTTAPALDAIEPDAYYKESGHDGRGLRVPDDLDHSICCYQGLSPTESAKFDRATFWMDVASHQWNVSMSSSFAALVSAIEALTKRGRIHAVKCPQCCGQIQHEVPGATQRFKDFLDTYAPEPAQKKSRNAMYSLRSNILHGNALMHLDRNLAPGWWNGPWCDELDLHNELWRLTKLALRNWLRNPPEP